MENLADYMNSLKKLSDTPHYQFDKICVPHSVTIDPDDTSYVIMDGQTKLMEYIKYRTDRLNQLDKLAE